MQTVADMRGVGVKNRGKFADVLCGRPLITWGTELSNQNWVSYKIGSPCSKLDPIICSWFFQYIFLSFQDLSKLLNILQFPNVSGELEVHSTQPAYKIVSDLSEFFFVHFRFTSTQDLSMLFNVLQFSKISIQQEERIWSTKPCKMVSDLSTINCN